MGARARNGTTPSLHSRWQYPNRGPARREGAGPLERGCTAPLLLGHWCCANATVCPSLSALRRGCWLSGGRFIFSAAGSARQLLRESIRRPEATRTNGGLWIQPGTFAATPLHPIGPSSIIPAIAGSQTGLPQKGPSREWRRSTVTTMTASIKTGRFCSSRGGMKFARWIAKHSIAQGPWSLAAVADHRRRLRSVRSSHRNTSTITTMTAKMTRQSPRTVSRSIICRWRPPVRQPVPMVGDARGQSAETAR